VLLLLTSFVRRCAFVLVVDCCFCVSSLFIVGAAAKKKEKKKKGRRDGGNGEARRSGCIDDGRTAMAGVACDGAGKAVALLVVVVGGW